MRILLISAVTCIALSSDAAQAGPNCMLMTSDQAMRDCFDRTFSTTPKPEPTTTTQNTKAAPKLASPPKTQNVSDAPSR